MKKSVSYVEQLRNLIRLDIGASKAYLSALENREVPAIHRRLTAFRRDHEDHICELSNLIRALGEEPPTPLADLKGYLLQKFSAISRITGTEGKLRAMRRSERVTVALYRKALEHDLPAEIAAIIQRNLADEERHLHYLNALLNHRPWDVPHHSTKEMR